MVISNLTKLYNITYAFSFTQDYIFQNKPPFYFWKYFILYAQLWFWWIQILGW